MAADPSEHVTACPPPHRRRGRRSRLRRGGATGSALTIAALFATLMTAAIVVAPAYLRADDGQPSGEPASVEAHQKMIDALAELISRSTEVLAIHEPAGSSYTELVLWLDDRERPGQIDPPELAVVSHSAVLHTIWFYTSEQTDRDSDDGALLGVESEPSETTSLRWSDIQRRLIASGVSAFEIEHLGRSGNRSVLLRIALTWSADSADGPDRASTVLDAIMRRETDA